jgi:hypothetical protein
MRDIHIKNQKHKFKNAYDGQVVKCYFSDLRHTLPKEQDDEGRVRKRDPGFISASEYR